jgi:hypothetical protein
MCRDTYSYVGRGLCLNGETTWERNLEPILPRLRLHMYIKLLLRRFVFLHRKRTVLVCTSKRSSVQSTLIDFLMFRYKTTKYLIVASGCSSRLWVPGLVAAVRGTMICDDPIWFAMIRDDPRWSAMIRDDQQWSVMISYDPWWSAMIYYDPWWSEMIRDHPQNRKLNQKVGETCISQRLLYHRLPKHL